MPDDPTIGADWPVWPIIVPQTEPAAEPYDGCTCWSRRVQADGTLHHHADCPLRKPAAEPAARWTVTDRITDMGWSVVHPEHGGFAGWGNSWRADALADHLNGPPVWTPPAPEPERPTWQESVIEVLNPDLTGDVREGASNALSIAVEGHGYRVVDVQALGDAIGWLQRSADMSPEMSRTHAQALLDALGVGDA